MILNLNGQFASINRSCSWPLLS